MRSMAPSSVLQQRVRARKDISDDEVRSESDGPVLDGSTGKESLNTQVYQHGAIQDEAESDPEAEIDSLLSSPPADDPSALSFGALVRAQEDFGKGKRPLQEENYLNSTKRARVDESLHGVGRASEARTRKASPPSRTSKHAPQALSSKHAVTRHRSVIDVPKVAPRDPRFDPLTGPLDDNRIKHNYDFLSSYRTSEISQLKSAIRASRTADEKEKLQKALRRMESKRQAEEAMEREQKVLREHRKQEKARVKDGKKPFYLKEGEIKKRAQVARFEGMGEKKREKVVERRRKKQAGKEKKKMPEWRSGTAR